MIVLAILTAMPAPQAAVKAPSAARIATPAASLEVRARKVIAARLVDPSSLQVRNVRTVQIAIEGQERTVLCGEYNARNRMGGFNGFRPFAFESETYRGVFTLSPSMDIAFYSEQGTGDFDTSDNPRDLLRAGVSSERIDYMVNRYGEAAINIVPKCMYRR